MSIREGSTSSESPAGQEQVTAPWGSAPTAPAKPRARCDTDGPGDQDTETTASPVLYLSDQLAPTPRPSVPGAVVQVGAGTRIGEQYVVQRLLGAGGMGLVYLARDETLMRHVAIKFVQPNCFPKEETAEHLMAEARAMARVKHRNVVDVYAFGMHEGLPYFVMEYIPGRTAEDWFVARSQELAGFLPIDEVLGVLEQCCLGVAAIHANGAVHGDLKPTNLLLGPDYRIAVADFGIAMLIESSVLRQMGGTPAYMAPEAALRIHDTSIVQRRDVFSIAVMAYEFLVGHAPFPSQSMLEFTTVPRELPVAPTQLRADLPSAFDEVILEALDPDPYARTPTVAAFWRELAGARRSVSERPNGIRILLVDDDDSFCEFVEHALLDGFPTAEFTRCDNGRAALRTLVERSVDIVLLDLRLPDINGIELTAEIRTRYPAWKLPILVVTAHGSAADWKLLSTLGADAFLVKPFDIKALTSSVGRLLDEVRSVRVR